jgi:exosortase
VLLRSLRPIAPRVAAFRELPLREAALVGLVLLAYNYSLMTLARGLTLQTPLAYLALVPLIALVLGVARVRIEPPGLPIHDRQVDWIVGLGLLAIVAAILILMPDPTSSTFWLQRIDLLTLPLFVMGLIALLFGVRRVWSLKGPIAFLLLAWPVPFTLFLAGTADQFTDFTARLVGAITAVVPIARPSVGDDTLFLIGTGVQRFSVSIGSACSGVNSMVGFLLLGTALLYVVRGPVLRRILWLAVGLALVFGLNVLRIIAILAVGLGFGQDAALEVLHPVAGLIVFTVGVVGMVALVPRFGLRFIDIPRRPPPEGTGGSGPVSGSGPVGRARAAFIVALSVTVLLAATNAAYGRFESISSGLGDARLSPFDISTAHVSGWDTHFVARFRQATQFFGASATWNRTLYIPKPTAPIHSTRSVYVDVLTTDDAGTFAAYGLQACYTFHGYTVSSVTTTDVGAGVRAQVIDYTNPKVGTDWSALWWEWPYTVNGKTRYERIVVFMANGPTARFSGEMSDNIGTQASRFVDTDRFLVTLGRAIVRSQLGTAAS